MQKNNILTLLWKIAIWVFAVIGFTFTFVYFAMHFGLLNVRGAISERNAFFTQGTNDGQGITNASSSIPNVPCSASTSTICAWNKTPEWAAIAGGLSKDQAVLARVTAETGIPERLIASVVVPEQIRFFTSEREVFKRYFEPLKILGSLSQFSLGVSGIKEATAKEVEKHATDENSPFYPGKQFAILFSYAPDDDQDKVLFNRLTDPKDHYYSYLYTAMYIAEIEAQWQRSGKDIRNNPEIIGTLWNIGFAKSKPNGTPQVGGAEIATGGNSYTFGELAGLFYYSDELTDLFRVGTSSVQRVDY